MEGGLFGIYEGRGCDTNTRQGIALNAVLSVDSSPSPSIVLSHHISCTMSYLLFCMVNIIMIMHSRVRKKDSG